MIPSFVSVDKVTNELVSMRASSVQIPDEIKGVKLNKEQQQALREGKGVFLENMISNRKILFRNRSGQCRQEKSGIYLSQCQTVTGATAETAAAEQPCHQ